MNQIWQGKICPLFSIMGSSERKCIKHRCAFYDTGKDDCRLLREVGK